MTTVILFIVLMIPGHKPQPFNTETGSLEECLSEVHDILSKPPNLTEGYTLQAGCVLKIAPSTEN